MFCSLRSQGASSFFYPGASKLSRPPCLHICANMRIHVYITCPIISIVQKLTAVYLHIPSSNCSVSFLSHLVRINLVHSPRFLSAATMGSIGDRYLKFSIVSTVIDRISTAFEQAPHFLVGFQNKHSPRISSVIQLRLRLFNMLWRSRRSRSPKTFYNTNTIFIFYLFYNRSQISSKLHIKTIIYLLLQNKTTPPCFPLIDTQRSSLVSSLSLFSSTNAYTL